MGKMRRLKYACYSTSIAMALVANLPPVLFLTFRRMYGLSYTQLGLLVLLNFVTQLGVDLFLSFFSHRVSISKAVKLTPVLTVAGLLVYALWPMLLRESAYVGLVLGTVIFSASSGLSEVLNSPVVAAIPAKDPDRQMSKLHSCYAWGTVAVVIVSTGFLALTGGENWMYLTLLFMAIPAVAMGLFWGVQIPQIETPEKVSGALRLLKNKGIWLCVMAIFLGGAAECTMSQWSSGYLEQALGIPKVWGDVFGVALFAVMLGVVTDTAIAWPAAAELAARWGMTPDQLGMKLGMLGGMLFPLAAVFLYFRLWKQKK